MAKPKPTPEELHAEGVQATLEKLESTGELIVEVGMDSFREILTDLFDLRWQNRQLQKRGTELVEEGRAWKRKATKYSDMLSFLGRCIAEPVNRKALLERCPELFDDAEAQLVALRAKYPHLFEDGDETST